MAEKDTHPQAAEAQGDTCGCAPSRAGFGPGEAPPAPSGGRRETGVGGHLIEQAVIPGGTFTMGDSSGAQNFGDGESPLHQVHVDGFSIDTTTVTNAAFAAFVEATGYRTEAEVFGFSAVFHLAFDADPSDVVGQPPQTPWWLGVLGSDWRHPGGKKSSIVGLEDHPVVHVSWNDARAYCEWAGRRLPSEAEWEYASRGGLDSAKYPWGEEEPAAHSEWPINIWQGSFPRSNTLEDGYLSTAPAKSYPANGYGLWQTVGNVWEWCSDWYDPTYYRSSPAENPQGPTSGQARVMRGGSFLCHISYCNRYRNSARSQNTPDSSMANAGFRTVALA